MKKFEENCFDLLRLIAALIVMFSHSFRWFDYAKPRWMVFFTDGSVGVMIFFAISGYLIMASYDRCIQSRRSIKEYFINRFFRIYPALIISFIVLSLGNIFFLHIDIFHKDYVFYFIKEFIRPSGGAYNGGLSNGVLWTLKVELIFYILVPLIYKFTRNFNIGKWCLLILLLWQFNLWDKKILELVSNSIFLGKFIDSGNILFFVYELLIGCFIYQYREELLPLLSKKTTVVIYGAIFTIWYCIYNYANLIPKFGVMHNALFGILVPPLVLGIGYSAGKIRFHYDISYGIYIYHMIVINILLASNAAHIFAMPTAWFLTITCAVLSCLFIERPALNFKNIIVMKLIREKQ